MSAFEFFENEKHDVCVVRVDFELDSAQSERIERHYRSSCLVLEKIVQAFLVEPMFEYLDLVRVMENGDGDEIFHIEGFGVV